jgi:hypothetical protein
LITVNIRLLRIALIYRFNKTKSGLNRIRPSILKKTSLCREGLGGIILPQLVYSKLQGRLARKQQLPGTQRKLKEQHLLNLIFPEAPA